MKKINKFFIYTLLFYLIYTPNFGVFLGIDFLLSKYILIPLIGLMFSVPYILNKKKIKVNKSILFLFIGIALSEVYFIIVATVTGHHSFEELRIIQNLFVIIHIVDFIFIFVFLKEKKYDKYQILNLIFNVTVIQSFICIIMYVFPSTKEIANTLYFSTVETVTNSMKFAASIRVYGISEEYTFGTQIFHSFMASIALVLGMLKDKKYLLYIPFLIIASVLNGRTSLIIFAFAIAISILIMIFRKSFFVRSIKYVFIICICCILLCIITSTFMPATFKFIYDGINQIYLYIFEQEEIENIDILINNMSFWPEGINFIFGEGHRVYVRNNNRQSDIGYVNDMFMGGLIYVSILYGTIIFFLSRRVKKMNDKKEDLINLLFIIISIVTLLISNYKGECMKGRNTIGYDFKYKRVIYWKKLKQERYINEKRINKYYYSYL